MFRFQKITPTDAITGTANLFISFILGILALAIVATMIDYTHTASTNKKKAEALPVVMTGILHKPEALHLNGCMILEASNGEYYVNDAAGSACALQVTNVDNWRSNLLMDNRPTILSFIAVLAVSIFAVIFSYSVVRIPGIIIGALIPPLRPYMPIMCTLGLFGPVIFMIAFMTSDWRGTPVGWQVGNVVARTYPVCVTDKKMYICPTTFGEWAGPNAMMEIGYNEFVIK